MQSAQWSEEKRRRGDNHDSSLNTYGKHLHTEVHPDQGQLEEGGNSLTARGVVPKSRDIAAAVRARRK
jgi:hypothetical protein